MTMTNENTPLTDAIVKLTDQDGNAFVLLCHVRRAILRSNHPELAEPFVMEATSGEYYHLLATCLRYVTVE